MLYRTSIVYVADSQFCWSAGCMTAAYFYVFMCFCDIVHFSLSVFVYFFQIKSNQIKYFSVQEDAK